MQQVPRKDPEVQCFQGFHRYHYATCAATLMLAAQPLKMCRWPFCYIVMHSSSHHRNHISSPCTTSLSVAQSNRSAAYNSHNSQ